MVADSFVESFVESGWEHATIGILQDRQHTPQNLAENNEEISEFMEIAAYLTNDGCIITTLKVKGSTPDEQRESARKVLRSLLSGELLSDVVAIKYGNRVIRIGDSGACIFAPPRLVPLMKCSEMPCALRPADSTVASGVCIRSRSP